MTNGGQYILDITDHFINNFGIVFTGLGEAVFLAWFFRLESIRKHVNLYSDFAIGKWWNFCLIVITPVVLGYMAIGNLMGDIMTPYNDYPLSALWFGWSVVVAAFLLSFALQSSKGRFVLEERGVGGKV